MKIFFPLMTNIEKVKYVLRATKVFGYESGKLLLKIYTCVYIWDIYSSVHNSFEEKSGHSIHVVIQVCKKIWSMKSTLLTKL